MRLSKKELAKIDSLEFIFTSPTFVADEVTDKFKKKNESSLSPKLGVKAAFTELTLKYS
jgi:hypothetical protein